MWNPSNTQTAVQMLHCGKDTKPQGEVVVNSGCVGWNMTRSYVLFICDTDLRLRFSAQLFSFPSEACLHHMLQKEFIFPPADLQW